MTVPTVPLPPGPLLPDFHRFRSHTGEHVLVVPSSAIYDLSEPDSDLGPLIQAALLDNNPSGPPLDHIHEPAPQNISLNVSNRCNLSCGYCYAGGGGFQGAQGTPMAWAVARAAIDRLLAGASRDAPVTIGFLGGEPFANRTLIHTAVAYASAEGARLGLDVRFSVTTNGTLLRPEDIALMQRHAFAVTVSIDGSPDVQNRQRPRARTGRGSWWQMAACTALLLAAPGRARIAARATVTRDDLDIAGRIQTITALGFPETGVSPLRTAANSGAVLRDEDWPVYFTRLTEAATIELSRLQVGLPMRLTNLAVALKQLHRGACSPYPCGAGGGYFSVAADGHWYACHRAVGDDRFRLGSNAGLDTNSRRAFLLARHVHAQAACQSCWARYLCSGACHQEAQGRTQASCDFIRAWLEFCLRAYCELSTFYLPPAHRMEPRDEWFDQRKTTAP
jgi:uncharacterized protein